MRKRYFVAIGLAVAGSIGCTTFVAADDGWTEITDPAEARQLISGKAIDGMHLRHYYRQDGNAAAHMGGPHAADSMVVRKWSISDDGKLCVAPFTLPDRIVECYTLQRTSGDTPKFRYRSLTGLHDFVVIDTIPEDLAEAVAEKAGALRQ